jgi:hypothetical protein
MLEGMNVRRVTNILASEDQNELCRAETLKSCKKYE